MAATKVFGNASGGVIFHLYTPVSEANGVGDSQMSIFYIPAYSKTNIGFGKYIGSSQLPA